MKPIENVIIDLMVYDGHRIYSPKQVRELIDDVVASRATKSNLIADYVVGIDAQKERAYKTVMHFQKQRIAARAGK